MPRIETLLLANHAEAHDGLLHLIGGGWDLLSRTLAEGDPLPVTHMGVGITVALGPHELDQPFELRLQLLREDDNALLMEAVQTFEVPPAADRPPDDQRVVFAFDVNIAFPSAGRHRLFATCHDDARGYRFRVVDTPG